VRRATPELTKYFSFLQRKRKSGKEGGRERERERERERAANICIYNFSLR